MGVRLLCAGVAIVTVACAPNGSGDSSPGTTSPTASPTAADAGPGAPATTAAADGAAQRRTVIDLPDAMSVNVTARDGRAVVAWTESDAVRAATLDRATGTLVGGWQVPGDVAPFPHPIERPALAIDDAGRVHLAFTTVDGGVGSVIRSTWHEGVASAPEIVSGPARAETVLVHMDEQPTGAPAMAWLEDSTLSVALADASGVREIEQVDDLTCDCCNPVPVTTDDGLVVAYRNQDRASGEIVRDVALVRTADGNTFDEPVIVADDRWFLTGCPFSGPDAIVVDGDLLVTWMDGRQSLHPEQDGTTIWVDRSSDGGRTFGRDVALTADGIHRWPVVALDGEGVVHIVWETQATDGGLSYAASYDGGVTFTPPRLLVPNTDDSGRQWTPSIAVAGDDLVLTWVLPGGARVAVFELTSLRR